MRLEAPGGGESQYAPFCGGRIAVCQVLFTEKGGTMLNILHIAMQQYPDAKDEFGPAHKEKTERQATRKKLKTTHMRIH
jgi:hypothetical protein